MLADAERDPVRRDLFRQLADAEREHAEVWRRRLLDAGVKPRAGGRGLKVRMLSWLARTFGPRFVLGAVAAAEHADRGKYAGQADALSLSADEHGHAQVLAAAAQSSSGGSEIGKAEPWHRAASGNNLRAAVLGVNDGLVSNFCLLTGIAGAGQPAHTVLLTGLAGLIAGACSMALGEWLSVANARELAQTQIEREREEIEQTPEAEQKELALILQAKGLPKGQAQSAAAQIMRKPEAALETLAREELGIDPEELGGNPWSAAGVSFVLFALGASVPVIPIVAFGGQAAVIGSVLASATALAASGVLTSIFNGRSPLYSAMRQLAFGTLAAGVTFGVGHLLGVTLGG